MKRLMDVDPITGIKTYHDYDYNSDVTYIERVQNVEPIIEANKAAANTDAQARGIKNCWWHAAKFPNVIIEKWMREYGIDVFSKDPAQKKAVRRKLRDPEWRYLNRGNGRL